MRGVLKRDHRAHREVDVAVDDVVVEHAAGLEESRSLLKPSIA
jgi:hypothetical protein